MMCREILSFLFIIILCLDLPRTSDGKKWADIHARTTTSHTAEFLNFPPNLNVEYLVNPTSYTVFRQQRYVTPRVITINSFNDPKWFRAYVSGSGAKAI